LPTIQELSARPRVDSGFGPITLVSKRSFFD
jgi:hypothetical protein